MSVSCSKSRRAGFTLLEMMVAMVVVVFAMMIIVEAMSNVQGIWVRTRSKVREYEQGRAALDTLALRASRATLNIRTELEEKLDEMELNRESDLHFVSGPASELLKSGQFVSHAIFFQAPMGYAGASTDERTGAEAPEYDLLPDVLNAWGYFVEFDENPVKTPSFLSQNLSTKSKRHRFRLMEFRQPAHELDLFATDGQQPPRTKLSKMSDQDQLYEWFTKALTEDGDLAARRCAVVAENVLAMIVTVQSPQEADSTMRGGATSKEESIAPDYLFDSRRHQWQGDTLGERTRHRLPPMLRFTAIVLDEIQWSGMTDSEAMNQGSALRGRVGSLFRSAASFQTDIAVITGELNRRKLRHQVVTTTVVLPGGRWMEEERFR